MNPTDNYRIPILEEMKETYGSAFEKLSNEGKIFLIFSLAQDLEDQHLYEHKDELYNLANRFTADLVDDMDKAIQVLKELVNSL